jgi:hypothetical protein
MKMAPLMGLVVRLPSKVLWMVTRYTLVSSTNLGQGQGQGEVVVRLQARARDMMHPAAPRTLAPLQPAAAAPVKQPPGRHSSQAGRPRQGPSQARTR